MQKRIKYVAKFKCEKCNHLIEQRLNETYFELFNQTFYSFNLECPSCKADIDIMYDELIKSYYNGMYGEFVGTEGLSKCSNCDISFPYEFRKCKGSWTNKKYEVDDKIFCCNECMNDYYK